MATFYLDRNVSVELVGLLRALGHEAKTATELGFDRVSDPGVLLWAANEQHFVITHNEKHFEMLQISWKLWSAAWGIEPIHTGIIAIKQRPSAAREIDQLVRERGPLTNQFFKYRLPDGWLVQD